MNTPRFYRILRSTAIFAVAALITACSDPIQQDDLSDEEWEEMVEQLCSVATSVDPIFLESDSVEDMVARIDEIKSIEGVVDAYATETSFYIDIDGWGIVSYPFDRDEEDDSEGLTCFNSMAAVRSGSDSYLAGNGEYKACIMNAQHQERAWTHPIVNAVESMFQKCGIEVAVNNDPTTSFFRSEVYDYNLVFVIAHGEYDSRKKLHWIETTETFEIINDEEDDIVNVYYKKPSVHYPKDEVKLTRYMAQRGDNGGIVFHYWVSEKFITNSNKRFSENGKAVIFMVPCQSLMGKTTNHEGREINDALAQAFFTRGAGLYIGYDESSSSLAQYGGMRLFANLLSGESFEKALVMPDNDDILRCWRNEKNPAETYFVDPDATYTFQYCEDYYEKGLLEGRIKRKWDVARHVLPAKGFQMDAYVVSPRMEPDVQTDEKSYQFNASAPLIPDMRMNSLFFSFIDDNQLKYGFCLSKGADPSSGKTYPAAITRNDESYRVDYQLSIPFSSLESNTEYHVWPYIADGDQYNFGESLVFTMGATVSDPIPESVDMGLSVKWASFNVGAGKPEESGYYFAWGETTPDKQRYDWSSYQWSGGEFGDELTRYCNVSNFGLNGFTDARTVLEPSDDAAHARLGGKWRMPTKAEFEELLNPNKCTVKWEPQAGVPGLKVTSKSTGKQLFFPAAGSKSDGEVTGVGTLGRYWSSSLSTDGPYNAYYLVCDKDGGSVYNYYRYYGYPVRAVVAE